MVEWKFDSSEERTINHVYFTIKRRQKSKYWTVLYIPVSVRTKATTAPVARLKPATQVFTPITKWTNKKYLQFYKEIQWQWSKSFKSIFIQTKRVKFQRKTYFRKMKVIFLVQILSLILYCESQNQDLSCDEGKTCVDKDTCEPFVAENAKLKQFKKGTSSWRFF